MTRATVVTNQEDVNNFYHYKKSTPPVPNRFPCIMIEEDYDAGLMGSGYSYKFNYPPITAHGELLDMWVNGFLEGIKYA